MSISAPEKRVEGRGEELARLNFNRSSLNASAWLRMRTGSDPWSGGRAAKLPDWLGGSGSGAGSGGSLPASINNALAATGMPSYYKPQPVSQAAIDAAQKQFQEIQGSNSIFSKLGRGLKTATNLGLQTIDFPLEFVRNSLLETMRDVHAFADHPSVDGFWSAVVPHPEEAVADTTVNAFINTVQKHGMSYALSQEGIGTGYTLDEKSATALEKENLAAQFYTLENGDPATIGRFLASQIGADKGSTFYGTFSGIVDATTLIIDPLNLVVPEAKATKASKALDALNATKSLDVAAGAVKDLPGALKSTKVREAFDFDALRRQDIEKLAETNPDLLSAITQARQSSLTNYTAERWAKAMLSSNINTAGLNKTHLTEAHKAIQFGADNTAEALIGSVNRIKGLEVEISRRQESIDAILKRADADDLEDQAKLAKFEAEKTDLEAQKALQEEANAKFEAVRQELHRNNDELDALKREHEAEVLAHPAIAEADQAAARAVLDSGTDLQAAIYNDLDQLPVPKLGDTRAGLQALYGIADSGVNMRTALNGLVRGQADVVAHTITKIDDFATMRDLLPDLGADTIRAMVSVTDKDEAMMMLAGYALNGHVGAFNNRMRLYLANRGERIGSQGSAVGLWESRLQNAGRRAKPAPAFADVEKHDDVVQLVDDQISDAAVIAFRSNRSGAQDWWDFRKEWINRIGATESWTERKRVVIELQDALIERIPNWENLDEASRDKVMLRLKRLREEERLGDERAVTARAEMAGGRESAYFGMLEDPTTPSRVTDRLIRSGVDLNREIRVLDSDELRKLYRAVDDAHGLQKAGKWTTESATALNDMFDRSLRPLYLTFRPAYMALQIADSSARSLLMGATSMISHPLSTTAVAASLMTKDRPWLEALTKNLIGSAPIGADGLPLFGSAQRQYWEMGLKHVDQLEGARHLRRAHFRDYTMAGGSKTLKQGWEVQSPLLPNGQPNARFHKAWAENALRYYHPGQDPMYDAVVTLRTDGTIPDDIMGWATERWGGTPVASPEDVITEYFHSGPGQTHLADIAAANRNSAGKDRIEWVFRDRERLKNYLFSEDEAYSVHNLASAHSGKFTPDAVNLMRDVAAGQAAFAAHLGRLSPGKAHKIQTKGEFVMDVRIGDDVVEVDFARPVDGWLGSQLKKMGIEEPLAVEVRKTADIPAEKGREFKEGFDRRMDAFFGAAGRLEKFFGQAPFLRDEVVLQTAKRVAALSREDAAVVTERMLSQMPRNKSAKLKQAEKLLKQGAAKADGTGTYTIEDITASADRAAFNELKNTMYGLKGRNASAQRMSLMFPFIQSSANGYRAYTRGIAQNPTRAINAMRAWENAKTEDSGVIYDVLPGVDRDDPTQPLVWTDAYGDQKFSVPFLGYAMHGIDSVLGALPFYEANPNHTAYMDVSVSKWNPMNFGEPLPGVGMGVTIPASAVKAAFGDAVLPSWLEEYIYPYQGSDVAQDQGAIYSNAPWFIKALFPSPQQQMMSTGTAMSALMASNPEKYADPATGYVTQEGASLLARDAADMAKSLAAMGQARAAVLRGGVQQPKTLKGLDGKVVAANVVFAEFDAAKQRSTSGQAYSEILDKYGMAGIAYLIGKRESASHATDAGYEFARANKDVLGASPDMLGYFFPASELKYRSPEYDRLLSQLDRGHQKSPEDYAEDVNRVLWQARVGQLDNMLAGGQITDTQYKTAKSALSDDYGVAVQGEFNTKRYEKNHLQLRTALTNQELASNPVGQSLTEFYSVYDEIRPTLDGETFTGKKDARQRDAMVQVGEALATANPAFRPLWDSQLKWEFREE